MRFWMACRPDAPAGGVYGEKEPAMILVRPMGVFEFIRGWGRGEGPGWTRSKTAGAAAKPRMRTGAGMRVDRVGS